MGIAALIGFAALLRVIRWQQTAALFNDGPIFLELARTASAGDLHGLISHPFHPLYPMLVALVEPLAGSFERAGLVVSVAGGSAAVGALHVFLRSAFGVPAAWVGALLLAVHPLAIEFSGDVQSEGLYLACFLGAVALLWRALEAGAAGAAAASGLLAGLAYLTRPEGLGVVAVGFVLALAQVAARRWTPARALGVVTACTLGAALTGGAYVFGLRAETGQWQLSQKKALGELVGLPPAPVPARPRALPPVDRRPLSLAPVEAARKPAEPDAKDGGSLPGLRALAELGDTARSSLQPALLVLLPVGLYRARGRPGRRGAFLLTLVGLYGLMLLALAANVGYVSRRHVLPPLVPAFGYAALGLEGLARALAGGLRRAGLQVTPRAAGALLLLAAVAGGTGKALKPQRREALAERRAAEWLRRQQPAPGPVAAHRLRVAYYAGARYLRMPGEFGRGTFGALRRRGVRYVILDDSRLDRYPGLSEAVPRQLRPIHRARAAGRSATVYELVPGKVRPPDDAQGVAP